jgi:hypothetical protein
MTNSLPFELKCDRRDSYDVCCLLSRVHVMSYIHPAQHDAMILPMHLRTRGAPLEVDAVRTWRVDVRTYDDVELTKLFLPK